MYFFPWVLLATSIYFLVILFLFMNVCYVNICLMYAVPKEARGGHQIHLEVALAAAVSHLVWVLGPKLRSPGRTSSKLAFLTTEPAL